jgi:hypothetical protein
MGFSSAWEANCNDIPSHKHGKVAKSFAYKSSYDTSRPSGYHRKGRGLHRKPPTYQFCETNSRGEAALEQGSLPKPPYKDYRT